MISLPDAPWIREAELYGMPPYETVKCPCCGEECDTIYTDRNGDAFACNECLKSVDAWDWAEEEKEKEREG